MRNGLDFQPGDYATVLVGVACFGAILGLANLIRPSLQLFSFAIVLYFLFHIKLRNGIKAKAFVLVMAGLSSLLFHGTFEIWLPSKSGRMTGFKLVFCIMACIPISFITV